MTFKEKALLIIVGIAISSATGFALASMANPTKVANIDYGRSPDVGIHKWIDPQFGNVCYVASKSSDSSGPGISCVQIRPVPAERSTQ
jgi:hypothetical protein